MHSFHRRLSSALSVISAVALTLPLDAQTPRTTLQQPSTLQRLTADSVIAIVVKSNPRVSAAAYEIAAAKGSRRSAGTWTNPTVSYQVENTGFPGQKSPGGIDREAATVAMIPLEPAYQRRSRTSRASAEVRATTADFRTVRRAVAIQAVSAFYSTALAEVSVDALDDTRAWLDSLTRYTGARVREGAAAEVDLIRLEVERDRAETDLALARVDLSRSRSELASLLGRSDFVVDISATSDSTKLRQPLPDIEVAIASAMKSRPEIAAANARLDAASSNVGVERSSIVRDLGAIAGMKSTAGTRSMIAGISVSLPLFTQNRGEIERAQAQQRIAAFNRQTVEREIVSEVTTALTATQTLSAQLTHMQGGLLRRAEESRRIAEAAYREGAIPLTQVIDAARTLAEARQLYFRALFAREQSLIELDPTIGGAR